MNEKIRDLFVRRMGLILDRRKHEAAAAVMQVRSKANMHGALHSSTTNLLVRKAYEEEYDAICKEAWAELHRIAVTIGIDPDVSLVERLKNVFDEVMKPLADSYLDEIGGKISHAVNVEDNFISDADAEFLRSREIVGQTSSYFQVIRR